MIKYKYKYFDISAVLLALEHLNMNIYLTDLDFINAIDARAEIRKCLSKCSDFDIYKMLDYLISHNLIKIENNSSGYKITFNFINTLYLMKINSKLKYK